MIERVYHGEQTEKVLREIPEEKRQQFSKAPGYSLDLNVLQWLFEQEDINYPPPRYQGRQKAFQVFKDVIEGWHPAEAMKRAGLRI